MSQSIENVSVERSLNITYGHIIGVLSIGDEDYYIPLVAPESTLFRVDAVCEYIPLEETPVQLAASYGPPRDMIGLRVRIEYHGPNWRRGVAKVVPAKEREPMGNETEIPSRGFRYAIAGGGSS
jgi:hypothetical protein